MLIEALPDTLLLSPPPPNALYTFTFFTAFCSFSLVYEFVACACIRTHPGGLDSLVSYLRRSRGEDLRVLNLGYV